MSHELYMKRCIDLAQLGLGKAAPNPMVGAVIVHNGKIIGEGYHEKFGEAHAEVNAINSVNDVELLKESTLYVSLEPCCHHGKTPPCTDLIIEKNIPEVVIGIDDPFPKVAGGGIEQLKNAGINVVDKVLEDQCRELNKRFFMAHLEDRPYIILKWAQSADGYMAPRDQKKGEITWISSKTSRILTHKWRSEEQGILVGSNTVKQDNPSLTTRDYSGDSPVRIILDPELETSTESKVRKNTAKTLIYNTSTDRKEDPVTLVKVEANGFLPDVLKDLVNRKIQSIIVEGGSETLRNFMRSNLWDEARVFTGKNVLHDGVMAPLTMGEQRSVYQIDGDMLQFFVNNRA